MEESLEGLMYESSERPSANKQKATNIHQVTLGAFPNNPSSETAYVARKANVPNGVYAEDVKALPLGELDPNLTEKTQEERRAAAQAQREARKARIEAELREKEAEASVQAAQQERAEQEPEQSKLLARTEESQQIQRPEPTEQAAQDAVPTPQPFSVKYTIGEELGRGSHGYVVRAQNELGHARALKIPHDTDAGRRLESEARNAAVLGRNPGIVSIEDILRDENGLPIIAMELMEGCVEERLYGAAEAYAILLPALAGLAHAHGKDILHRDIKRENILVKESTGKLADFGLGLSIQTIKELALSLTQTGTISPGIEGTLSNLPPEVLKTGEHTKASDVYAFALTTFRMLSGKERNDHESTAALDKNNISKGVQQVLFKALSEKPADRYQDASAFYEAFNEAVEIDFGVPEKRKLSLRERLTIAARERGAEKAREKHNAKQAAETQDPQAEAERTAAEARAREAETVRKAQSLADLTNRFQSVNRLKEVDETTLWVSYRGKEWQINVYGKLDKITGISTPYTRSKVLPTSFGIVHPKSGHEYAAVCGYAAEKVMQDIARGNTEDARTLKNLLGKDGAMYSIRLLRRAKGNVQPVRMLPENTDESIVTEMNEVKKILDILEKGLPLVYYAKKTNFAKSTEEIEGNWRHHRDGGIYTFLKYTGDLADFTETLNELGAEVLDLSQWQEELRRPHNAKIWTNGLFFHRAEHESRYAIISKKPLGEFGHYLHAPRTGKLREGVCVIAAEAYDLDRVVLQTRSEGLFRTKQIRYFVAGGAEVKYENELDLSSGIKVISANPLVVIDEKRKKGYTHLVCSTHSPRYVDFWVPVRASYATDRGINAMLPHGGFKEANSFKEIYTPS